MLPFRGQHLAEMPGCLAIDGIPEAEVELPFLPHDFWFHTALDIFVEAARCALKFTDAHPEVTFGTQVRILRQAITAELNVLSLLMEEKSAARAEPVNVDKIEQADVSNTV